MKRKLIFTLYQHKYLGIQVVPVMVNDNGKAFYSVQERITPENLHNHSKELSEDQLAIIKITHAYSNQQIFKRFTNKKITLWEFFQKLSKEYIQDHIRPFIDKQVSKVLETLPDSGMELYDNLENEGNIYKDSLLGVFNTPAETVFNFIRNDDGLRYFQTIRHNGKDMKLTEEYAQILTIQPCWLVIGSSVYTFNEQVDGNKLRPFLSKQYVHIPRNMEEKYFETFIKKIVKRYPVHAEGFEISDDHPEIKTFLSLEKDWRGDPGLRLYFVYGKQELMSNQKQDVVVNISHTQGNYKVTRINRKRKFENHIINSLKKLGLKTGDNVFFKIDFQGGKTEGLYALINFINEKEIFLQENKIGLVQDNGDKTYFTGAVDINIKYFEENDWFDIHALVRFGQYTFPFAKLKKYLLRNIREFNLPNGEIAILPLEWFEQYQEIMAHSQEHDGELRLQKHHFTLIREYEYRKEKDYTENLKNLKGQEEPFKIPSDLKAELRAYQKQGVEWLKLLTDNGFGACLADDMGLGKTLQTLTLLLNAKNNNSTDEVTNDQKAIPPGGEQLDLFSPISEKPVEKHQTPNEPPVKTKDQNTPKTSLIVMPASLVHNWFFEINRFAPNLRALLHIGNNRSNNTGVFSYYDLVLTTYGIVRNDISILEKFPFHFVVLDESQVIKNPDSKSHESICRLKAQFRITLTGTPIENSLVDLWSQMQFLNPDMLGSLGFFKRYYQGPIEKDKNELAEKRLKKIVQPFILRRTKQEVEKDLPPLTEKAYYCDMSESQYAIYESEKSRIRNHLLEAIDEKGIHNSRFIVLRGLMRLRQIANHPALAFPETEADSGKFSEIIFNIENLLQENHKVLIFSSFVKHLELFEKYFHNMGWKYAKLTGQSIRREAIIRNFKENEKVKPFLISLKAGGVGLNLPEADYVFMLEPWWNPAAENQAVSRAHRIGQNHNVFVYKFIARETLEEKIIRLQEKKSALAETFVRSSNPLSELTRENLEEILD